jgi:Ethanolamine utilization protein EutJ (predicted chaperonin)
MKLFQIEEPDGSPPAGADGPGAAVGIDLASPAAEVAIALGGNAELLPAREGDPPLATAGARDAAGWRGDAARELLLALRARAERALARPVTHAVIVAPPPLSDAARDAIATAAANAGYTVLRIVEPEAAIAKAGIPAVGSNPAAVALGAAILAEEDAPRPASSPI